jgi:hypothetical protein
MIVDRTVSANGFPEDATGCAVESVCLEAAIPTRRDFWNADLLRAAVIMNKQPIDAEAYSDRC